MPTCGSCGQVLTGAKSLSDLQRAYWFAVIVAMVAEYTGDDRESTHEDLKRELWKLADLPQRKLWKSKRTGKWRSRRLSIRDLSTSQMTHLIDVARKWAAEKLSLDIPCPDPGWRSPRRAA
jgi:hypothetical protein